MLRKVIGLLFFIYAYTYAQPYGLTERVANTSLLISISGLNDLDPQPVFSNISFQNPIFLTHSPDNSDRIFVVEKAGRIKVFPNDPDISSSTEFLNLVSQIDNSNEGGLLGLAFHPDFANNGKFYVYYTDLSFTSIISEFGVSGNPDEADPTSERILMEVPQTAENHNAGMMAFGPDQMLYVAFGDGGGSGDPLGNSQNLTNLLGSIIRIDVDNQDTGLEYAIPPDNPFVGNENGWREEIWAYGLRNPWRFSFDELTGELYCADVGQDSYEEIDIIKKGKNYGWNIMEGFNCYNPSSGCDTTGLTLPIYEYDHSLGFSVTGGYVYRGDSLDGMAGAYIYGDYVTRKIWALRYENGIVTENREIAECPGRMSSFGTDEQGEIYVLGYVNHTIYKLRNSSTSLVNTVPDFISTSGLYSNIITKDLSPGLIPFDVNATFWSDGSYKERILALPNTEQIAFEQDSPWDFPNESVIVKNFYVEMEDNNPASKKIIETRFMVKQSSGSLWNGFSYHWNDGESDAYLLDDSLTRYLTITNPDSPGGSWIRNYYYPSPNECMACHSASAGFALGLQTSQTNCDKLYENNVTDNQLRIFNNIDLFTEDIGEDYTGIPEWQDPTDPAKGLNERGRSYLATNCSFCHMPGGSGRSEMDLQYDTHILSTNMIDVDPIFGNLNVEGAKLISPGFPENSVLYMRMVNHGAYRMPPLASNYVDTDGAELIYQWITSLGGDIPLPVSMIEGSFQANESNSRVKISWQTSSESDILYFELFREFAGNNSSMERIAQILPDGNQAFGSAYTFEDMLLGISEFDTLRINYFLYQIDLDGSKDLLAQTTATTLPIDFKFFNPFPNPTNSSSVVRFFINQAGTIKYRLFSTLGKEVLAGRKHYERGEHRLLINLDALGSNLYFLKLDAQSAKRTKSSVHKILLIK